MVFLVESPVVRPILWEIAAGNPLLDVLLVMNPDVPIRILIEIRLGWVAHLELETARRDSPQEPVGKSHELEQRT